MSDWDFKLLEESDIYSHFTLGVGDVKYTNIIVIIKLMINKLVFVLLKISIYYI